MMGLEGILVLSPVILSVRERKGLLAAFDPTAR